MTIGIFGRMGSGKSLFMSIFGSWLKEYYQVPLYANYCLQNSLGIDKGQLLQITDGIVCLDEFWLTMESRAWDSNKQIFMTHWFNQTRKKNLLILYTTQAIDQIEKRVRNGTDLFVHCEKKVKSGQKMFQFTFIDGATHTILRKFHALEINIKSFYTIYNSFEFVKPL